MPNRSHVVALNRILDGELDWPARLLELQRQWPDEEYEDLEA